MALLQVQADEIRIKAVGGIYWLASALEVRSRLWLGEDAPQRDHDLREIFNGLRWVVRIGSPWRYMPHDLPP